MSVAWKSDVFGYDGDLLHGRVAVNYWQPQPRVLDELDRQLAAIRREALAHLPRLTQVAD